MFVYICIGAFCLVCLILACVRIDSSVQHEHVVLCMMRSRGELISEYHRMNNAGSPCIHIRSPNGTSCLELEVQARKSHPLRWHVYLPGTNIGIILILQWNVYLS